MAAPESRDSPASPLKGLTILGVVAAVGILGWWGWQATRSKGEVPAPTGSENRSTPVRLAVVEAATIEDSSTFVGTLAAERVADIRTEISGRLQQLLVQEGQTITEGSEIAQLFPEKQQADFDSAQANIRAASAARTSAAADLAALEAERPTIAAEISLQEAQLQRISSLADEGAIAAQQFDLVVRDLEVARANLRALERRTEAARARLQEAEATLQQRQATAERDRRELQDATLTAPFAGTIDTISVKVGDFLAQGDRLATLVANQNLELRLAVPIEQADRLHVGLPVRIVEADSTPIATGRIAFVSPQVDAQSQSIAAKARFPNPDARLRNGQFVRAELVWETRPDRPVIPANAVVFQGDERFVFVARPDTKKPDTLTVERRALEIGRTQGDRLEIRSGLVAGERIVVSGTQRIAEGSAIAPLPAQ